MIKNQYVLINSEVKPSGFFLPPPFSMTEPAKTLAQWFTNQSRLCDSITHDTICVFKIFNTPDKDYASYLAFASRPEGEKSTFEYLSSIGNSFKLEVKSLTSDQVLEKIVTEYNTFSRSERQEAEVFEKAESVNLTYDNYHIIKLYGN